MLFILHVTCSCISHAYVLFFQYICYLNSFRTFLIVSLSLPLSFVCVSLCLWHLNASLLCPKTLFVLGASTSFDPTPSSIWFRDENARKAFLENFSQRGIHSECQVILADFANTDLPDVIHSRGWESLCDILVTCPFVLIQKFYSNMHGFDSSVPLFHTRVRGTRIVVTPKLVSDVLRVPRIEFPDYLGCKRLRIVSKDELKSAFCEHPFE